MNTLLTHNRKPEEGSSLFLVMVLIVIAFMGLASVLSWSTTNALTTGRNNQYWRTVQAAEAATEKVLSRLATDFQSVNGESRVYGNMAAYRSAVPTANENSYWSSYGFSDGHGNLDQTDVNPVGTSRATWTVLNSQYAGLFAYTDTYQIRSYARENQARFNVSAGVQQTVQLATIPAFQFAIFYNMNLEIEPGPNMTVTGRVHGNRNIYQNPVATLTFLSDVTAAGTIIDGPIPGDPAHSGRSGGTTVYKAEHDSKSDQLTLPISTGSDPNTVYEILKPPPSGGDTDPALASQRYYNKADIIIQVTDAGVIATSGSQNQRNTSITVSSFVTVSTNKFYNGRERKGVNVIDIDVKEFKKWADSSTGGAANLWTLYGREPSSIYVIDERTAVPAGTEPGVRLSKGEQLPNAGLTVATPAPLYVQGDFNIEDSSGTSLGSDTTHTKPSSLVADAITVLSKGWDDIANATINLNDAKSTTVNAAFLAGIVATDASSYSGGVENFPRFLENWNGDAFTYNGSMVVMFYSRIATGLWRGTGSTGGYYNPPVRAWTFDTNFMNPAKLPPCTPAFRVMVRGDWTSLSRDPAEQTGPGS